MRVVVLSDYDAISKDAARLVEQRILENDHLVLGLATGSTPLGLYENLIEGFKKRGISYQQVKTINLDEYIGLEKNHPESYHTFMKENLFSHIDIKAENTHIPMGDTDSVEAECERYEKIVNRVGPINLQILGIGSNGHIGFNEPGTKSNSETHVVELNDSTRKDNAQFFDDAEEVPTHAITLGIQNILSSDQIILLATGKNKAEAVKTLLEKHVDADFPASFLWNHPDVTVIVDEAAYELAREASK